MPSTVTLGELASSHLAAPVPYAALAPESAVTLPLCLLLMGAGGTRDSLVDLQPFFGERWADGRLAPMVIATPSPGMDYYLEDPNGAVRWDSFLSQDFLPHLRQTLAVTERTAAAGISGGGYGALKLAFARPHLFDAVAAMQPMLEPGFRDSDVGARNRLHHSAGGPVQLIGPGR